MAYIITVGREYGSGGRFIAKLIAEKLGFAFYDNELLTAAAMESGLSESIFQSYDEKKDGFLGSGLGVYSYDMTLGQKVFLAQFDAIRKIASIDNCVIVGRCADFVLKDYDNVLNIFICAPMEEKIERVIKYYGVDPGKAESVIIKKNKKRKSYYNYYTDKEWGKAANYDLCINSKIGIDESVEAIMTYVKHRFKLDKKDN